MAVRLTQRDDVELVMVGAPRPAADDLRAAIAHRGGAATVVAAADIIDCAGARVAILGEGAGEREHAQLALHCPDAVAVVTGARPLERTVAALRETEFPRARVIGVAGAPSAARLRARLAADEGVSPASVVLPPDWVTAGDEDPPGPALAAALAGEVLDAVLDDSRRVVLCAVRCDGEYGIDGAVVAAPVVLGAGGVRRIVEVALDDASLRRLRSSAAEASR
jgi:hypothetical protein